MCITDLGKNQKGIITSIDATDPYVQRLMMMGFVEGAEIEHLTSVGTAHEVKIYNTVIAFSIEQAQYFTVELI